MLTSHLWRLSHDDTPALESLLDADPVLNVYLRSELRVAGMGAGQWWGVGDSGRLRAALLGGPLVTSWLPELDDADWLAEAISRQQRVHMLVGQREQVLALHRASRPIPTPRETRDPQPFLVLRRGALTAQAPADVRRGGLGDLDRLIVAAADMHREEMGVDPLAIDPIGWRSRMTTLIQRGWSWVWVEDGRVLFKAELSAWTPQAVQIQGVWTAPAARNRGIATAALAAVCRNVMEQVPACTLYVNHYNLAARGVYARLGFEHVADFATLFY